MVNGRVIDPIETAPTPFVPAPADKADGLPVESPEPPDATEEEAHLRAQPTETLVLAYWQTHCCIKNTVALDLAGDNEALFRHMRRLDRLNAILRERFLVH